MSHFTEIKSTMRNVDILKEALAQLQCPFEIDAEGLEINGFMGDKLLAEIKIKTDTSYDIGLRRHSDGHYEFVADWESLKDHKFDCESFTDRILQKYSLIQVMKSLEERGFSIENSEVDDKGNVQMVVCQW